MESLLMYIALLLILAKTLEIVTTRLRVNPVVAHIIAGTVLGPALLSLVIPNSQLEAIAYLGLLLLMFYTGLTTNFNELRMRFHGVVLVGLTGVAVTFMLSYLVLKALGFETIKSLIISAVLSNTASETVAVVMASERRERIKSITIGASIVDDVVSVIVLSIITATTIQGISMLDISKTIVLSITMIVIAIAISEILVKKPRTFYRYVSRNIIVFASSSMALLAILALIAHSVGLSELIGAYIAGLIMGRGREVHDPLLITEATIADFVDQLKTFLEALALPLFFTYVGLVMVPQSVDPYLFSILLTVAIAGKFIGCGVSAFILYRGSETLLGVGTAMIGRGALEAALLNILREKGLLSIEEYSTLIVLALTTCILAPSLYSILMKPRRSL